MPFSQELTGVYYEVKKIVEGAGFKCLRADELSGATKITDDIWLYIQRARFAIADITGSNANVFYEVGLSHALGKPVILLIKEGHDVPFDLKGIRYLKYSSSNLADLRKGLLGQIKGCLRSIPESWNKESAPEGPAVRIFSVDAPDSAVVGKPVHITVKAKNFGLAASQTYFSLSFPSGVSVGAATSDLQTKMGVKGKSWKSGQVILDYPIVEAFVYKPPAEQPGWPGKISHFLTVEITPVCCGLMQFYASASAKSGDKPFVNDPKASAMLDQRDEPVYCGVIEVH